MSDITINWGKWSRLINKDFIEFVENKDRYLILYGGRGSSKSNFAAKKLIYRCLNEKYFKCVLIRKTYSSIQDSSYEEIKSAIQQMGLSDLFHFKVSPLEITCKVNGNKFIARGCDDTTKLKSIKDPSAVWYEEDIIDESDFITITTGVRTKRADYLQEIFTINPEVEGKYQENWFYKRFFEGHSEKSFRDLKTIRIDENTTADITYTVMHSTYRNNKWIPDTFIAFLVQQKTSNPYYYDIYTEGNWGNKTIGGLAYKKFVRATHCSHAVAYNPDLALHISFDFNVKPYMTMTIWQMQGKSIKCIDCIAAKTPDNTTRGICKEFIRRYNSHKAGLFIYGDPSGRNEDTKMENGFNNYTIIEMELEKFHPELRVGRKHPPLVMRLNFINTIFESNFNDISIEISENAIELITDLMNQRENADGTKMKEKVSKNGETYEKYGHMSDSMDYFICEALIDDFKDYQDGPIRHDTLIVGDNNNFDPLWTM